MVRKKSDKARFRTCLIGGPKLLKYARNSVIVYSEKLQQLIQRELSKKKKLSEFFLYIWNLQQILNFLQKKMTLFAYVFRKLRTAKDVVR